MKRLLFSALALFGLVFPAVSKADPVDFSYSFAISPASGTVPGGTGGVTFSLFAGGPMTVSTGAVTSLPAASLFTNSSAGQTPDSPPDSFDNSPYTLSLHVKDTASGAETDFAFGGHLNGTLTATGASLTAKFDGPLSQEMVLGGYNYAVSVEPETANLLAPGSLADVLLNANVTVTQIQTVDPGPVVVPPDPSPGPVMETPEPATLLLGLLAGPAVVLLRRRKRA